MENVVWMESVVRMENHGRLGVLLAGLLENAALPGDVFARA